MSKIGKKIPCTPSYVMRVNNKVSTEAHVMVLATKS